jgi:hypothetical protein
MSALHTVTYINYVPRNDDDYDEESRALSAYVQNAIRNGLRFHGISRTVYRATRILHFTDDTGTYPIDYEVIATITN